MCCQLRKDFSKDSIFHYYGGIYSGDRSYQGSESGKNINEESDPNKHQRTHFPENQYKSKKCGKVFYDSSNLTEYHWILTKEKAYFSKAYY